jgi:glycolate oxidase
MEGIEPTMALRLRVVGGRCAGFVRSVFHEPVEVDRQLEINGVKVVVDEMSDVLVGTQIDYIEGLRALASFNSPNVKSTCGCGAPLASDRYAGVLERELGADAVIGRVTNVSTTTAGTGRCRCSIHRRARSCVVDGAGRGRFRDLPRAQGAGHPRGAAAAGGGALPFSGGVVLSTERMQAIKEIDPDDLVCVVEPGVVTGRLPEQVEAQELFYPPDPASLEFCSIGGNASTNAGGPRAFKYGVTREYILGLEVALMGGEILKCGRRTAKGVTGYDLVAGFVGTEGTFGVITELTVKLLPKPQAAATVLGIFADIAAAGSAISALLRGGLRPRELEVADRASIDHVRPKSRYRFPATPARSC